MMLYSCMHDISYFLVIIIVSISCCGSLQRVITRRSGKVQKPDKVEIVIYLTTFEQTTVYKKEK